MKHAPGLPPADRSMNTSTALELTRRQMLLTTALACTFVCRPSLGDAQSQFVPGSNSGVRPNLAGQTQRPLRYRPDGPDFVIENGTEFFNRSLYGGNTAFRVDGGDKPEFVMYLPGRGGNLRFALRTGAGHLWLHEARHILTRYRPGELHYEIRDPAFGTAGVIRIAALAYYQTEGLIVRIESAGFARNAELLWIYGGVNGERGARDGDIGTERVPISEYFQFKPEFAIDNVFDISAHGFHLASHAADIVGVASAGAKWATADASSWNDLAASFGSAARVRRKAPLRPIVVGRSFLAPGKAVYVSLQRIANRLSIATELSTYREVSSPREAAAVPSLNLPKAYSGTELPALYESNVRHFAALRGRVRVTTPDPYIDAAAGALNVAADAVWDAPQQAIMHGAIAWRAKLLGWRGPYALDALGWHDRARRNFAAWTGKQNLHPIPPTLPPADENSNLSRNETGLHSNGDISNSHYDMNMVFVDALLRHLLWTGDKHYAREVWPLIERHLAWERRLFRREFGPKRLPLYEAYATIWASDDVQYGGGGVSYSSAYNQFHNRMAARIARLLGFDAAPYEREADLIAEAMQTYLWLEEKGAYAEYKDYLGDQLVHPSAGLWSFYHCIDSGALSPKQAWRMAQSVDRDFAHIPVHGPGVPADADYHVLPTTDWMPYSWSVNNVVMGENLHTALGFWQAGRADDAFTLLKSALLASMYMGISPGNVGTMNYLDVYRREAQRDFADGAGVMSRALIEGLFGIRPDALDGVLRVSPGFPSQWREASLEHPDFGLRFSCSDVADRWSIHQQGKRFSRLELRIPARREQVRSVKVNGRAASWRCDPQAVGGPFLQVDCAFARSAEVSVEWKGKHIGADISPPVRSGEFVRVERGAFAWWVFSGPAGATQSPVQEARDWNSPQTRSVRYIDLSAHFNDRVADIFKPGKYRSPRSPFVSLALPAQGLGAWAGHVNAKAEIDDGGLRRASAANGGMFAMPNGLAFETPGLATAQNIVFTSQWDNYPRQARIDLAGRASRAYLLMAGSTNHMQSRIDNGEVVVEYADGSSSRLGLRNPETWWPIDQDYFIDDYQFGHSSPLPPRVDLKTGQVRLLTLEEFKGRGGIVPGGAATVLELPLDASKDLRQLIVRALANDVVIGLMAVTIEVP
jgi:hypothetical protein